MAKTNKVYQFEYMNECDKVDKDKVIKWLNKIDCEYLMVLHDKDDRDAHYHTFVKMKNNRDFDDIAKQVGDKSQYIQHIKKWKNALAYAFHLTENSKNDGKYQYTKESVVSFKGVDIDGIFETAREYEDNNTRLKRLLFDYGECRITKDEFIKQLGGAENYSKVHKEFKKMQEYRQLIVRNRDMLVMYICGDSESGKTTLAKYLARIQKYDFFVSGSGADVLDGYDKEECIILDDLRGDVFKKNELFKLTDNHTNSSVKSRFHNKDISFCKLMIITSVKTPQDLYNWETITDENKDETFKQFARRLNYEFYYIHNDDILRCKYDIVSNDLSKVATKTPLDFKMSQVFALLGIEKKLGSDLMDKIFAKVKEEVDKKQEEWDKDLPF